MSDVIPMAISFNQCYNTFVLSHRYHTVMTTDNLVKYNFYIDRELLERLKAIATKERRSYSSTIVLAVEEYLKARES